MKRDTAHYYIDWISMNFITEQLLLLRRNEDARLLAEYNGREFPTKDLVIFTLGKAYEAAGRKQDAIIAYKKTLALYPSFEEARNRLKVLE